MKELRNKLNRKLSLSVAKSPEKVLLFAILILNIVLVFGAAGILVALDEELQGRGFFDTAYHVFTMILDAGCIESIASDHSNAGIKIFCIIVILIGTLIFTGAIIGYLSNLISNFISDANNGKNRLLISDHIVIVNWNNRAAEIINDLLYSDYRERVVVLVNSNKEDIEQEIKNRISDTVEREKKRIFDKADRLIAAGQLDKRDKKRYFKENYQIQKLDIVVRQGEVYSLKQLNDISVSTAKNIIILGKNQAYDICKYQSRENSAANERGNIETIKTLVQISEITAAETSADNQRIVVEVEDDWTMALVQKIIKHKENKGKCNIIPVPVNRILGQILSQFSIMPELNTVYSQLFSNKGATFYAAPFDEEQDEIEYFNAYFQNHDQALPITTMRTDNVRELFYVSNRGEKLTTTCATKPNRIDVRLNPAYEFEKRHIVILGHNSKCIDIFEGFLTFLSEWNGGNPEGLIDILVIDDEEHLKKVNYYDEYRGEGGKYSFIKEVVAAEVYDAELIQSTLNRYIAAHSEDTSVLILSDDYAPEAELDSKALTYLVYLQDIIYEKIHADTEFKPDSIDVIVELLNPKNHDVVKSYSVNNVIISNRYISRMIVQIGEKESIYEFYKDILTYDTDERNRTKPAQSAQYESKELYIKSVSRFFAAETAYPIVTTPRDLVASVYYASPDYNKTIILGMIKEKSAQEQLEAAQTKGEEEVLFAESKNREIVIDKNDKLVLFSPH